MLSRPGVKFEVQSVSKDFTEDRVLHMSKGNRKWAREALNVEYRNTVHSQYRKYTVAIDSIDFQCSLKIILFGMILMSYKIK